MIAVGARVFRIADGEITAQDEANRYITNFNASAAAAQQPGPFIYSAYPSRIQKLL